ncbi:MAG TPA: SDR family NAD(P)-dependent oxidoreductase [Pyrinomonadaceae bacterium]|nr:SDR family NAD(P)-dependent oxidoreductase [Pyrinomonadaceae bacterium]
MDWTNKVVLITGASSGIGRGLAVNLARRGAAVGLLARRRVILDQIAAEIINAGGRARALPADVTQVDSVRGAVEELRQQFGPIDVLVANAGISINTSVPNLCEKEIAELINVNVIGVINSVSAVLPNMIRQGHGHLVVNSSLAAYRGLPKSAAYCASKAAISSFFEALRIDLKGSGVDVTIIHPGFVKTPLIANIRRTPFLMEVDYAVQKIIRAIEKRKKGYAFPWQLATLARACKLLPIPMYDWIAARNSFRG